ncbi:hypothetical protein [Vagococcus lutrae]|uniref:hypothetical protein n=1 Tax=Vagococcus lutrae TaxID=81947 RepID=UPI00288D60A2|nr:hypothetical protein [Vagococcus lutrae]MDT2842613.1 hypothetical protein [Vagococcus lutrae]
MAKFEVLERFRDKHTKEVYEKGAQIELTIKRSEEVVTKLGDGFLKRLEEPKKTKKK